VYWIFTHLRHFDLLNFISRQVLCAKCLKIQYWLPVVKKPLRCCNRVYYNVGKRFIVINSSIIMSIRRFKNTLKPDSVIAGTNGHNMAIVDTYIHFLWIITQGWCILCYFLFFVHIIILLIILYYNSNLIKMSKHFLFFYYSLVYYLFLNVSVQFSQYNFPI